MSDPTNIDDHRPHAHQSVECLECQHRWQAVYPEGAAELECPQCGEPHILHNYGTEIIGPFRGDGYYVSVGGFKVPHILLIKRKDLPKGYWECVLDGRLAHDMPTREVLRWMPLVANAMAVAAGYSSFGENCRPSNPYQVRIGPLGEFDDESA